MEEAKCILTWQYKHERRKKNQKRIDQINNNQIQLQRWIKEYAMYRKIKHARTIAACNKNWEWDIKKNVCAYCIVTVTASSSVTEWKQYKNPELNFVRFFYNRHSYAFLSFFVWCEMCNSLSFWVWSNKCSLAECVCVLFVRVLRSYVFVHIIYRQLIFSFANFFFIIFICYLTWHFTFVLNPCSVIVGGLFCSVLLNLISLKRLACTLFTKFEECTHRCLWSFNWSKRRFQFSVFQHFCISNAIIYRRKSENFLI